MTRVYCTNKLKAFIGEVEETLPDDCNDIKWSDWYAHLFYVDKRKCIVFVNILTYYTVFVVDIVKKDVQRIDEIFMTRLKEQMRHDMFIVDINHPVPVSENGEIKFIRTSNNKKAIGKINEFVYMFKVHCIVKYEHLNEVDIVYENGLINKIPTGQYTDIIKTWTSPVWNLSEKMKTGE